MYIYIYIYTPGVYGCSHEHVSRMWEDLPQNKNFSDLHDSRG